MKNVYLNELKSIMKRYKEFDQTKIPLCAAETYTSKFTKQALNSFLEGKYITGFLYRNKDKDFIGSDYLYEILLLANKVAKELYGFDYNDFRPLSGMNTVDIILMSLFRCGDKLLITGPKEGGHGSLIKILDALNIKYDCMPYDYDIMQVDYEKINQMIKENSYDGLFFCQSDLINPIDLRKIVCPDGIYIIYDVTQILGLIAGQFLESPIKQNKNIIMIGGTHKTLPSVTCGQISTSNRRIIDIIDRKISPDYLRNPQINLITSVLLTMIEMMEFGKEYAYNIVKISNKLGDALNKLGVKTKRVDCNNHTRTHQIFIELEKELDINDIYRRFANHFISINKRDAPYCYGFRIGVQEIARYGWEDKIDDIALLIKDIIYYDENKEDKIKELILKISKGKDDCYLINDIFMG